MGRRPSGRRRTRGPGQVLSIRVFGDPVLRESSRPVEVFDDELRRLAADMLDTMYEAPGVGLAAPQIGRAVRLIVWDDGESGPRAMANPVLAAADGEQEDQEGCLSVPGLYFDVKRAMWARAEGLDMEGTPLAVEGEGLLARILQHEIDHVNGRLILDRISDRDRRRAMAAIREADVEALRRSSRP